MFASFAAWAPASALDDLVWSLVTKWRPLNERYSARFASISPRKSPVAEFRPSAARPALEMSIAKQNGHGPGALRSRRLAPAGARTQPSKSDLDKSANGGLRRQAPRCCQGVDTVARQLLGCDVCSDIARACALRKHISKELKELVLRLGKV